MLLVGRKLPAAGSAITGHQRSLSVASGLSPNRAMMRIYCPHWCPVHWPWCRDSLDATRR